MMKNLLFVYICLFGLALPLSAQKLDAQDILDVRREVFKRILRFRRMRKVFCRGVLSGLSV